MKDQILQFIKERDHVSFIELSNEIPGFAGDYEFYNLALENVVLWNGVSKEAVDALKYLLSNSLIFVQEVEPLVYLHDGYLPTLPTATVAKSHKTAHWLPIVFSCKRPI